MMENREGPTVGCCGGGGMFGDQRVGNRAQQIDGQDLEAILKERLARGEEQ